MELFHANEQWANRPDDERFPDLQAMRNACYAYATTAVEATVTLTDLRVDAVGKNDLRLTGKTDIPAKLTHHAFGQLCERAKAPAGYLRGLPATLAAQNLNHGLKTKTGGQKTNLLVHSNGDLLVRAATSDIYQRVWNFEVIDRLMDLSARHGLVPARPTFRQFDDGHGNMPALYASDHDMFAFLMSEQRELRGPLGELLLRGVIAVNSEVGQAALKFLGFYFREICGNHIIWGAQEIAEVRIIHVGDVHGRMGEAMVKVRKYMDGAASLDEAQFTEVTARIAADKNEVLDAVFGKLRGDVSRKALSASYDAVVEAEDGDPRSKWGLAQGITRYSQTTPYADERTALDRAAGKLLKIAF